jgi:4-alpha-glucanotransferase
MGTRRRSPVAYHIAPFAVQAYRFADWLAKSGLRIWQVLPLGPVGYGESPYQLSSAFRRQSDVAQPRGAERVGRSSGTVARPDRAR